MTALWEFQEKYGSVRRASLVYLAGEMPVDEEAAFELALQRVGMSPIVNAVACMVKPS